MVGGYDNIHTQSSSLSKEHFFSLSILSTRDIINYGTLVHHTLDAAEEPPHALNLQLALFTLHGP